jgi:hypothetical protein
VKVEDATIFIDYEFRRFVFHRGRHYLLSSRRRISFSSANLSVARRS